MLGRVRLQDDRRGLHAVGERDHADPAVAGGRTCTFVPDPLELAEEIRLHHRLRRDEGPGNPAVPQRARSRLVLDVQLIPVVTHGPVELHDLPDPAAAAASITLHSRRPEIRVDRTDHEDAIHPLQQRRQRGGIVEIGDHAGHVAAGHAFGVRPAPTHGEHLDSGPIELRHHPRSEHPGRTGHKYGHGGILLLGGNDNPRD